MYIFTQVCNKYRNASLYMNGLYDDRSRIVGEKLLSIDRLKKLRGSSRVAIRVKKKLFVFSHHFIVYTIYICVSIFFSIKIPLSSKQKNKKYILLLLIFEIYFLNEKIK